MKPCLLVSALTRRQGFFFGGTAFCKPSQNTPSRQFGDRKSLACDTLEGDVEVLLEALRRVGVESAVVVDLTRPGMDVPVVRAMVPELEPPFVTEYYTPGKRARRLLEGGEASG